MSASPLDLTFNGGQAIVNANPATGPATSQNSASAVAVQADGKVVVVGAIIQPTGSTGSPGLAVRRYNTNGTLDTTFGTAGEADIPLPTGSYNTVIASSDVILQPDGKIVFSGDLNTASSLDITDARGDTSLETVVARLDPDGTPDATFGTAGETIINSDAADLTRLALQADGKILLGGTATPSGAPSPEIAVTRLNADGSIDTGFNGGTIRTFDPNVYGTLASSNNAAAVAVTPAGKAVLAWTISSGVASIFYTTFEVAELNADGSLNTSFGTDGISRGPTTLNQSVDAATVQADGKIVLAGTLLNRLNADGSIDTSFASPALRFNASSVAVQADGGIVVGGVITNPYPTVDFAVARYTAAGLPDGSFGPGGTARFEVPSPSFVGSFSYRLAGINAVALAPDGQVVAVGTQLSIEPEVGEFGHASLLASQAVVTRIRLSTPVAGDYDGDGRSDVAAELSAFGLFAVRQSTGGDVLQGFGPTGTGQTIPAPGDYDGDGKADVAAYLPAYGVLVYRPSSGGADVVVPFGMAGTGNSIPAPGDYDGDGKTDVAVYLPSLGILAYRPSSGGADVLTQFGFAGTNGSIPAPGDYDGDGKTDVAAYLPSLGIFAYRPSSGGADVLTPFGAAGVGNSIPAPGDYDGDGKTDLAIYLPGSGELVYRPSMIADDPYYLDGPGGAIPDVAIPFGLTGSGGSIPAPGDYDGDGRTDAAVYLPSLGLFAYRPSSGGADVLEQFGATGTGQTVPATSIPYAQPATVTTASVSASAVESQAAIDIPLTDDLIPSTTRKKASFRFT